MMHVDDSSRHAIERFMRPAETLPLGPNAAAGAKAGAFGGVVMLFLMLRHGSLLPLRIAAFAMSGDVGFAESTVGLAVSVAAYMVWSIGLGAAYGLLMARLIGRVGVLLAACCGVVFGLLTWIISQYVLIGYAAPNLVNVNDQPLLAGAHLVYGLCLGFLGNPTHTGPGLERWTWNWKC